MDKTEIVEKRVKRTIIRRRKSTVEGKEEVLVEKAPNKKKEEEPVQAKADNKKEVDIQAKEVETQKDASETVKESGVKSSENEKKKNIIAPVTIQKVDFKKQAKESVEGEKKQAAEESQAKAANEDAKKDKKSKLKKVVKKKSEKLDIDGIGEVASIDQLNRIAHTDRVERVFQPTRSGRRKKVVARKGQKKTQITESKAIKRIIDVNHSISVGDLAKAMGVKAGELIKSLMKMGTMATINQDLDFDTAQLIAQEYKYEVKDVSFNESKILSKANEGYEEKLETRPPVVTVMGHVDHGKTSLLDAIRKANVTAGEAGGITQHIGAYTVNMPKGKITFLDTPGHEAFTSMRARGASITDVVILVVAADDGVMPQTVESIDHAKAAGVPIVVAVNKIDKPEADADRVKRELSERGLVAEEWGGDTVFIPVSAKENQGIDVLLENVLLQSEMLELEADPAIKAQGIVIEAQLDRSRGPVATLLVQKGTLKVGQTLVAGSFSGRVRAMRDATGAQVDEAGPSYAVEVMGLDGVPAASDTFNVLENEQEAKELAAHRLDESKKKAQAHAAKVSLEQFFAQSGAADGEQKELCIIFKADVQGSLEAVKDAISKLSNEKVKIKIIHDGVGGISESDVILASASNAIIIGFNVRPETKAISLAENEGIDIKLYKVIYEMVDEVKLAMEGLLAPKKVEKYLGRAEVRDTFTVSKIGTIAGCYVIDGLITRNASLRLLRDSVVLYEGGVSSLKRFKEDVKEVKNGFECGLGIEGYQDIKSGDVIEAFEVELVKQSLEDK